MVSGSGKLKSRRSPEGLDLDRRTADDSATVPNPLIPNRLGDRRLLESYGARIPCVSAASRRPW